MALNSEAPQRIKLDSLTSTRNPKPSVLAYKNASGEILLQLFFAMEAGAFWPDLWLQS